MTHCNPCNFLRAIRTGKWHWNCADCYRDLSDEYLDWARKAHPDWFDTPTPIPLTLNHEAYANRQPASLSREETKRPTEDNAPAAGLYVATC